MKNSLDETLGAAYKEYVEYLADATPEPAIQRLAELYNALDSSKILKKSKYQWLKIIKEELLVFKNGPLINRRLIELTNRITKIISVGDVFDEDEILLILTFKIEVELTAKLLFDFKIIDSDFKNPELDDEIKAICHSNHNEKNYELAVRLLRKNTMLPLSTDWF